MTGADRLCDVLLANGVDVCFANPGTSEMHFVAALDRKPAMRCVLGLFEGVVTGAADGYGRMRRRPAVTLLHTGPGLANGLANLHNARRARSPILNVVGDHASYHLQYDAPLTSDIESLARPMSNWVRRVESASAISEAAGSAYLAATTLPGVATLILPADAAWGEIEPTPLVPITLPPAPLPAADTIVRGGLQHGVLLPPAPLPAADTIRSVANIVRQNNGRFGLLVGGNAALEQGLAAAERVATSFGGQVFTEVLPPRVARGRGRAAATKIPYFVDPAVACLRNIDLLILVGAPEPVAFFAYPGKPSRLVSEHCKVVTLAGRSGDQVGALAALADELGAVHPAAVLRQAEDVSTPVGTLTEDAIAVILAQEIPEGAIVCDEGLTSARRLYDLAELASPHDYLMVPGGSIGLGIPMSIGAAIACPERKVITLQADGSGLYTLQGLWTQARENLDIVTIVFANRAYAILQVEMRNLGFNDTGRNATRMMSLTEPAPDWVHLARGMGVEAVATDSCEQFADLLRSALMRRGPFLVECQI
jgi:acetolactate synthase-1/2/3 large subunit